MSEKFPAISALLKRSEEFPVLDAYGRVERAGFGMDRDGLIALLQECTPLLRSISVIPHHVDGSGGDMTSFTITTYVSFARSEMEGSP